MVKIDDDHFAIVVNDDSAQYPVLVDPSLQNEGYETSPGGSFGYSVAWFRDVHPLRPGIPASFNGYSGLLVGAPNWDNGSLVDCGKVFFYDMADTGGTNLSTVTNWTYTGTQSYEHVGCSVADGQLLKYENGSKQHSILVGAWGHTGTYSQEGAAFVFHRGTNGFPSSPDWIGLGGQANANFGWSVAGIGDVNGVVDPNDSQAYDEILIGAPSYSTNGHSYNGKVAVYSGSYNGVGSSPIWTAYGMANTAQLGTSVAGGNVDGTNLNDLIIGAPGDPSTSAGAAYIYTNNGSGSFTLATTLLGQAVGDQFGTSVASGFDVNHDGYDDVLVGAPDASYNGHPECGEAYLYEGVAAGVNTTPKWITAGTQNYEYWGTSVAGGDMNNDFFADVIIGSPGYTYINYTNAGRVDLFVTDTTTGLPGTGTNVHTVWGLNTSQNLGNSVAYAPFLVNQGVDGSQIIGGAPGASPPSGIGVQVWLLK
jgi:hypothetical protein